MKEERKDIKVLLLGVDTSTKDALEYLKARNIYTVVTDYNNADTIVEKKMADDYWMIDVSATDELEKLCIEKNITNLYAGNHEFCLDQCRELSKRLGFPFYASDSAWHASRDKEYYKKLCRDAGLCVPQQYALDNRFNEEDLGRIEYPVIVKPNDGSSRKGVYIINNKNDLNKYFFKSLEFSQQKKIIIEDYISGEDIVLFGYVDKKKLFLLDVYVNHSIIINNERRWGFFSHDRKLVDRKILEAYQRIILDIEYENGFCAFQGIYKDGQIYNTEVGLRLDGLCTWRRFDRIYGINYLKMMVDLALGEKNKRCLDDIPLNSNYYSLSYIMWGKPGLIREITGRDMLYGRDDLIVLWDRYQVGDTIPALHDLRTIAVVLEVFGNTAKEIKNKIRKINNYFHVYDLHFQDLLEYRVPELESWTYLAAERMHI